MSDFETAYEKHTTRSLQIIFRKQTEIKGKIIPAGCFGRINIPKVIIEQLGLKKGDRLRFQIKTINPPRFDVVKVGEKDDN